MNRKGPIELGASQASISTAIVSIKTIQVNNRQMTQSVFRQLPKRGAGRTRDDRGVRDDLGMGQLQP